MMGGTSAARVWTAARASGRSWISSLPPVDRADGRQVVDAGGQAVGDEAAAELDEPIGVGSRDDELRNSSLLC